jgi:hypothetical protein
VSGIVPDDITHGYRACMSVLGSLAVRLAGGMLFAAGAAGFVVHYGGTYWMRSPEIVAPALLVIAGLGLVAVVSGGWGGPILGGLSIAFGLSALACVVAQTGAVETSSDQRDRLTIAALALAILALGAGLEVIGESRPGAKVLAAGLVVTGAATYRLFRTNDDTNELSATLAVATLAGLAQLTLLIGLVGRPRVPRPPETGAAPSEQARRASPPSARPAAGAPGWLERAAAIVGMVTAVIVIGKEFENLLQLATRAY